jgi:hypothetical protein
MDSPKTSHWDLSFCGLNCAACEIYQASHGDDELHDALLKFFQENIDSSITAISCEKCRSAIDKCWTGDCHFRSCATERRLNYCFECKDFACNKLVEFTEKAPPNHANMLMNLQKMKEIGIDKWIASQKEVKFCP